MNVKILKVQKIFEKCQIKMKRTTKRSVSFKDLRMDFTKSISKTVLDIPYRHLINFVVPPILLYIIYKIQRKKKSIKTFSNDLKSHK